jgi:hypothetical protein
MKVFTMMLSLFFGITSLLLIPSVPQYNLNTESTDVMEDSGYGWWWILLLLFGCGLLIYLFSTFSRDISGSSDLPVSPEEIVNDLTRIEHLVLTNSQELVLKDLVSLKLVDDSILRDRFINLTGSLIRQIKESLETTTHLLTRAK